MTIDELLALANLTASDEIPVWDAEATGEPTKKITAQQLAAAVVALANLVTGVKGNAETTYRHGDVNLTPANIGAVSKTGDKMTSDLMRKATNVDASKANNNVSSTQYPSTFIILDNNERIINRLESVVKADGTIGGYWYLQNYDTSGNAIAQKGIRMTMDKNGTLTYSFDDHQNALAALGAAPTKTINDQDIDNVRTPGLYYIQNCTASGFQNAIYGALIVCGNNDGSRTIQIFCDMWSDDMWKRRYSSNWTPQWQAWKKITVT